MPLGEVALAIDQHILERGRLHLGVGQYLLGLGELLLHLGGGLLLGFFLISTVCGAIRICICICSSSSSTTTTGGQRLSPHHLPIDEGGVTAPPDAPVLRQMPRPLDEDLVLPLPEEVVERRLELGVASAELPLAADVLALVVEVTDVVGIVLGQGLLELFPEGPLLIRGEGRHDARRPVVVDAVAVVAVGGKGIAPSPPDCSSSSVVGTTKFSVEAALLLLMFVVVVVLLLVNVPQMQGTDVAKLPGGIPPRGVIFGNGVAIKVPAPLGPLGLGKEGPDVLVVVKCRLLVLVVGVFVVVDHLLVGRETKVVQYLLKVPRLVVPEQRPGNVVVHVLGRQGDGIQLAAHLPNVAAGPEGVGHFGTGTSGGGVDGNGNGNGNVPRPNVAGGIGHVARLSREEDAGARDGPQVLVVVVVVVEQPGAGDLALQFGHGSGGTSGVGCCWSCWRGCPLLCRTCRRCSSSASSSAPAPAATTATATATGPAQHELVGGRLVARRGQEDKVGRHVVHLPRLLVDMSPDVAHRPPHDVELGRILLVDEGLLVLSHGWRFAYLW
mmetsp:Transcript_32651/g.96224  ORF Transcript_32651/g.96224 Transcript_32651/m.96224 type:complete len:554 (+) Transcript_32651:529-2190(+)